MRALGAWRHKYLLFQRKQRCANNAKHVDLLCFQALLSQQVFSFPHQEIQENRSISKFVRQMGVIGCERVSSADNVRSRADVIESRVTIPRITRERKYLMDYKSSYLHATMQYFLNIVTGLGQMNSTSSSGSACWEHSPGKTTLQTNGVLFEQLSSAQPPNRSLLLCSTQFCADSPSGSFPAHSIKGTGDPSTHVYRPSSRRSCSPSHAPLALFAGDERTALKLKYNAKTTSRHVIVCNTITTDAEQGRNFNGKIASLSALKDEKNTRFR